MGSLEISDPMTMYKSLNDIRETIARINQQQQEIYKNTYGELPIEKPTSNSRPAIYDNNGNKIYSDKLIIDNTNKTYTISENVIIKNNQKRSGT